MSQRGFSGGVLNFVDSGTCCKCLPQNSVAQPSLPCRATARSIDHNARQIIFGSGRVNMTEHKLSEANVASDERLQMWELLPSLRKDSYD